MNYDVADVHDVKQWLDTPKKRYTLEVENDKTGERLVTLTSYNEEHLLEALRAYGWPNISYKRYTLTVENDVTGENLLTISAPSEEMMLERLGSYERYIERAKTDLALISE